MVAPPMKAEAPFRVRLPGLWLNVLVLVLVAPAYVLTLSGAQGDPTWVRVLFVVLAVVLTASVVLAVRAGVWASADGLSVRSPSGRARRLTWDQIHHFEMRGYRKGLGLWTVDGRWIRVLPYGAFEGKASESLTRLEACRWRRQQQLGLA